MTKVPWLVQRGVGFDYALDGLRHTATTGPRQAALDSIKILRGKLLDNHLAQGCGIRRGLAATVEAFYTSAYRPSHGANRSARTEYDDTFLLRLYCNSPHMDNDLPLAELP